MSEERINVKKSILSPDVAPFVPKYFQVENCGLSNFHSEPTFTTMLSGIEIPQPSKWEPPIIYSASMLHNAIYPYTHMITPECSFQTPIVDSKCFVSTLDSQLSNKTYLQQKKYQQSKKSKKPEISETVSNSNRHKRNGKKKRNDSSNHQVSSDLSNFKIKSNYSEYKQIKPRLETKEISIKFDSNVEFPTLPSVSNKDVLNESKQSNLTLSPSNFSYSSVVQYKCKGTSKSEPTVNNNLLNKDISSEYESIEKSFENLHIREKKEKKMKSRNFSRTNNQRDKEYCKQDKTQKVELNQRNKKQLSEPLKILKKKNLPQETLKNCDISKTEGEIIQQNTCSGETVEKEVSQQSGKTKKRRKNRKKKKTDSGKVSLLSPEMFAAITKQFAKSSDCKSNNFNLSDEEFPDLSSSLSQKKEAIFNSHNDTVNDKTRTLIEDKSDIYEVSSKSTQVESNDSGKYLTFSSILKMPRRKTNHEIQTEKLETNSDLQKEIPSSGKTKKVGKKKKKNKESTNIAKSSKSQEKHNPVIELSITEMINSLQLSKLNQKKKKDLKPRVISTKRGIMDKMLNPHNMLDSSAPMKKRGKERERPGKKRISAMRKVILREREKRKQKLEEINCKNIEETKIMNEDINNELRNSEESFESNIICKSEINNHIEDNTLKAAKIILHTRKFRDYCNHMLSEEIDSAVKSLLKDLIRFQDRLHQKDPVKARMKRRLVQGIREVTKHLRLSKLKCIVIAPDIEKISAEGGLNDALQVIINLSQEQKMPCVFALQRRTLGKLCMKSVPVSCVGIFNYEGSEENFHTLIDLVEESKNQYLELLKNIQEYITKEIESQVLQPAISDNIIQTVRSSILRQLCAQNISSQKNTIEELTAEEGII